MASLSSQEQVEMLLNTQEKTIRYAQSQLSDGELINGKSMLDITLRQMKGQSWV